MDDHCNTYESLLSKLQYTNDDTTADPSSTTELCIKLNHNKDNNNSSWNKERIICMVAAVIEMNSPNFKHLQISSPSKRLINRNDCNNNLKRFSNGHVRQKQEQQQQLSFALYDSILNDNDVIVIAEALRKNNSVSCLNLSMNCISDIGVKAITDMIMMIQPHHRLPNFNNTLTTLNLDDNIIGNDGAYDIARVLQNNSILEKLYLYNNDIGDDGVISIAESIANNTKSSLQELRLGCNQLTDTSVVVLADMMADNKSLLKLGLENNFNITCYGADAIGIALRNNTTLTHLQLYNNLISDTGAETILETLEQYNKTIVYINLQNNNDCTSSSISDWIHDKIAAIVQENKKARLRKAS